MIGSFARKIFGNRNDRVIKKLFRTIEKINALEPEIEKLSDAEIKAKTEDFRQRLKKGETEQDIVVDAFAVVREAARRTLGERHYDVQLIGGLVMQKGMIAEMRTGEGKTLSSTLAIYLNALSGKGVHVITVNDYLAKRDSEWMGQVYEALGLTSGCIQHSMNEEQRRAAYSCDVTYGTNNEFGFDYLRDNMKFRTRDLVQRPFNFAIIDEVDSILIDEARTPLIISGPAEDTSALYTKIDTLMSKIKEEDFEKDEKTKVVTLTESGTEKVEKLLVKAGLLQNEASLYDMENISLVHHVNMSLRAHKLFTRDKDYIVHEDGIVIIDEFTGRMMPGRRYSEGLHQAIEAKEKVTIQRENQTLASVTFQNYFRLYPKLSGMTGTAMTEAEEFAEIYGLDVIDIPTNKPVARVDHDDEIYRTQDEKNEAIVKQVKECFERGQPVLIGTTSIEKSEQLSKIFKKNKIKHNVLNARHHENEAFIVAQAGQIGGVTIATNMAGRGTDIKLGGNTEMLLAEKLKGTETEAQIDKMREELRTKIRSDREKVTEAGGLFVIGTERHESRRIDNQLRGRSGRQGDAGGSKFYLSLEDDLMRIFGAGRIDGVLEKLGVAPGQAITHPWINKAIQRAQRRVEAQHFDIRKNLLKFDNVMNDQRKAIYEQRREIMQSDDVSEMAQEMRDQILEDMVLNAIPKGSYKEQWNLKFLKSELLNFYNLDVPLEQWAEEDGIAEDEIIERLIKAADDAMAAKEERMSSETLRDLEKMVLLQILDQLWKEHLQNLDHLRQGISLRAYGQRDPLNEYKSEAFSAFEAMLAQLRQTVTQTLMRIEVQSEAQVDAMKKQQAAKKQVMHESRVDPATASPQQAQKQSKVTPMASVVSRVAAEFDPNDPSTWGRVPRNALCPCGSGKKYKHCHGAV